MGFLCYKVISQSLSFYLKRKKSKNTLFYKHQSLNAPSESVNFWKRIDELFISQTVDDFKPFEVKKEDQKFKFYYYIFNHFEFSQ